MNYQNRTWLVVLDSTLCRVYDFTKRNMLLVKEIQHPENKLKDIDISSDKPGHYKAMGQNQGTYTQESDPKRIRVENFSKEIIKILELENHYHAYEKLILAATPHMKGLVLKHGNKQIKKLISHSINKDLVHLPEVELYNYVKEAIKPH